MSVTIDMFTTPNQIKFVYIPIAMYVFLSDIFSSLLYTARADTLNA